MVTQSKSSGSIHYVYALVGGDRFMRGEALAALLRHLDDGTDAFDPARVDGASAELADVLDDVRTLSLLGGLRVVVVDDADALIKSHRSALESYAADPVDSGCLILLCNSLAKNTRLYKIINAHGKVVECASPKPRDLPGWITARSQGTYAKRMTATTARRLVDLLGNNPGVLDAELAKLATYVGHRDEIKIDDLQALTGKHREEKIFAVMDAIAEGRTSDALRDWRQVLDTDRAAPARAVAGLAWAVRSQIDAFRQYQQGASLDRLAYSTFTTPDRLRKRLESVSLDDLQERQHDLLAAELACKTGASTVETAIEKFIVTHSRRGKRQPS